MLASLEVFRYCFAPAGQVLSLLALAGTVSLWQRGLRNVLALLLVPIFLPLLAAQVQAYPFGGSRVLVYVTPALALLIAAGLPVYATEVAFLWRTRAGELCRYGVLAFALLPLAWAAYRVIDPWPRADCAGAADYVLSHRLPGDGVAANHWEYAYYVRHLGPAFRLLEQGPPILRNDLWLVATAGTPTDRQQILQHFGQQGWQMRERREFKLTTVVLLSRFGAENQGD